MTMLMIHPLGLMQSDALMSLDVFYWNVQRGMAQDGCMSCGPFDSGVCISSSVCCLPLSGCRSSPSFAARCQLENAFPRPCVLRGRSCGSIRRPGVCVVDGVCCSGGLLSLPSKHGVSPNDYNHLSDSRFIRGCSLIWEIRYSSLYHFCSV